jgi:hypothetical protein
MITNIENILKAREELSEDLTLLLDNFTKTTGWEVNYLDFGKRSDGEKIDYVIDTTIKYKKLLIDSSYKKIS